LSFESQMGAFLKRTRLLAFEATTYSATMPLCKRAAGIVRAVRRGECALDLKAQRALESSAPLHSWVTSAPIISMVCDCWPALPARASQSLPLRAC
jgi:hypothetical protein